jgi:H+/Cl- antiporter ClcA
MTLNAGAFVIYKYIELELESVLFLPIIAVFVGLFTMAYAYRLYRCVHLCRELLRELINEFDNPYGKSGVLRRTWDFEKRHHQSARVKSEQTQPQKSREWFPWWAQYSSRKVICLVIFLLGFAWIVAAFLPKESIATQPPSTQSDIQLMESESGPVRSSNE